MAVSAARLRAGLVETLHDIAAEIAPDWVIMEPTGLASPGDLVEAVRSWAPEVDDIRVLTVVDAGRLDLLMDVAAPLIEAQIKAGSVVAVNKIDEVDDAAAGRRRVEGESAQSLGCGPRVSPRPRATWPSCFCALFGC